MSNIKQKILKRFDDERLKGKKYEVRKEYLERLNGKKRRCASKGCEVCKEVDEMLSNTKT